MAINWLVDAGLVLKVNRIEKPTIPLEAYADFDAFKLFLLDIGLLNAMAKIDPQMLIEKNSILTEFKGALTKQYVCQQLKPELPLYYWVANNGKAEIDFLIQKESEIIPIEVKAEENLMAKSLKVYVEKYAPKTAIRTSMNPFREESWLTNIPLYHVGSIMES